uniref:hematopoietic cell signal transducer isoform X1 n=1 Tax=Jaculus jaculus TaxID=51337 RepID=UPI001E1B46AE|nr:hematopoietic cell signal transducer isoform X1 [Jaculus jaculus]
MAFPFSDVKLHLFISGHCSHFPRNLGSTWWGSSPLPGAEAQLQGGRQHLCCIGWSGSTLQVPAPDVGPCSSCRRWHHLHQHAQPGLTALISASHSSHPGPCVVVWECSPFGFE